MISLTVEERFWAKVDRRGPDDCWLWRAAKNSDGYGLIRVGGRKGRLVLAHRLSLILVGRDPGPLNACHSCDTPACVNPAHLSAGTQAQNLRDGAARGRINRGSANVAARLNDQKVRRIRALAAKGKTIPEIAPHFDVSKEAIRDVLSGRTWAHVDAEAA